MIIRFADWLHTTIGLCAGVALEFRLPEQMSLYCY